jgi:Tol biopolymer transport system component
VWLYDLARQALTPLTADGKSGGAFAWSPDSRELMFSSTADGPRNIRRLKVDAPGLTEPVLRGPRSYWPLSWLPDGRLTFMRFSPETQGDVLLLGLADRRETPIVAGPSTEWGGRVSADGQWFAYVSNESGRFEAMIARLSQPERRWQVSLGTGHEVVWSRKGLELYYRTDSAVMAATINPNADPPIGPVRQLFENRYLFEPSGPGLANYDVSSDGRFLMIKTDDDPNALMLRVVFNWGTGIPGATSR